jgi:hypothetical protein
MAQGCKTTGRTSGAHNRKTQTVSDRLEALGCDPIESMVKIAMDEIAELSIRAQMDKELAQYVASKKAIEVSGEEAGPEPIKISWAQW